MALDAGAIASGLTGRRIRGPVLWREVTASTNDDALALAHAGQPEGAVVIADHQAAGRGRRGRSWDSRPGAGLLLSVILRPGSRLADPGLLSIATGLATAQALRRVAGVEAGTKWPNDALISGRKVAGVLIEGRLPSHVAIGVGVNVLGAAADLGPDLRGLATTLETETGDSWVREALAVALLDQLDTHYDRLLAGDGASVLAAYRGLEVTIGAMVTVRTGRGETTGRVIAISDRGGLIVDAPGEPTEVHVGEVISVRPTTAEART